MLKYLFRRPPIAERALAKSRAYDTLSYLDWHDIRRVLRKYPGRVDLLSAGQSLVFRILSLSTEVNNGGVTQYIWNSSGDCFEALLTDLANLEAQEIRLSLLDAREELFEGAVPEDIVERREAMERYFTTVPFNFDDDMDRVSRIRPAPMCEKATHTFYDNETDLVERTVNWVRVNQEQFGLRPSPSVG